MPPMITGSSSCGCCPGGTVAEYTLSGSVNDFAVPSVAGKPADLVRLNVTADSDITGMVSTLTNQEVTFLNTGTSTATFRNESASSSSSNRFTTATGGSLALPPGKAVTWRKDPPGASTPAATPRWRDPDATATSYDRTPAPTVTLTTSQNNWAPPDPAPEINISVTNPGTALTGVVPPPGLASFTLTVLASSPNPLTLPHLSASSTAANRLRLPAAADVQIPPGGSALFVRDPDPASAAYRVEGGTGTSALVYADAAGAVQIKAPGGTATPASRSHGTLAALGSTQSDAALIVTDGVLVTGADGTKGARLPDKVGAMIVVGNDAAGSSLKLYPPSGQRIGTAATDAAVTIVTKTSSVFARLTATQWTAAFGGAALP